MLDWRVPFLLRTQETLPDDDRREGEGGGNEIDEENHQEGTGTR